jgi:hypothetical protein
MAQEHYLRWDELSRLLDEMTSALEAGDFETALGVVRRCVPDYTRQNLALAAEPVPPDRAANV